LNFKNIFFSHLKLPCEQQELRNTMFERKDRSII